jgi:hypothetical protein
MEKSKVTLDIMHGKELTSTGKITSAMLVVQHLRSIFCNKDWDMEHTDMKIQQVVVMYLNTDHISRPPAPPIVSPCKVRAPSRPFGQKTNLLSHHHQGFGIVTLGLTRLS